MRQHVLLLPEQLDTTLLMVAANAYKLENTYIENTVTYSISAGNLHTDSGFYNRDNINHHIPYFQNRKSSLESVGINTVSQFPICT